MKKVEVFVVKTYDKVSSKVEFLFIDKEDYFIDSVLYEELSRISYSDACKKFSQKNPLPVDSEYKFIIS
jgi:hypothetical protein|nr:MAG TPA: hypothetical protein [Caudoviricetes sp.]